ncbi:AAA family ATPase [Glycomyces sp. NRRL B-16210]|uniref:AAA family ATPase n=1 Tax=Glycomyces sp. NRRL B-16210 TaxID=1463821 RepID=UPI0005583FA6|nr:AAA family ATPase [Glycomyces sp. NRRL B-16210]
MRRHILTGAPGSGKTTVANLLAAAGRTVVAEAATDRIAAAQAAGTPQPWNDPGFCETVAKAQRDRQAAADALPGPDQYFDRSPVCTLALARFLGQAPGPILTAELDRIRTEGPYQRRVYCFDLLGFITPTPARRIDLDAAKSFEQLHLEAYTELGFTIERLPAAAPAERAALLTDLTEP